MFGPFFLRDDYLFAIAPDGSAPACTLYVDLRDALRTGQQNWKKIDPKDSIAIMQAFSVEEDDLRVVVSVLR